MVLPKKLCDYVGLYDAIRNQSTTQEESTRLVLVEFLREICAVTAQDCLAPIQKRELQIEIL